MNLKLSQYIYAIYRALENCFCAKSQYITYMGCTTDLPSPNLTFFRLEFIFCDFEIAHQ